MSNELTVIPFSDIDRMGEAIANSGLFGMKTKEQAVALMLVAQAEGLHPAIAARDYHIMNGKPSLKADAMLARFHKAGGKVEWISYTDEKVEGKFSHPQGGEVQIAWTFEQAKKAGLTNKDTWKNYARAMLRARVISEAIRTVFPGVSIGMYTPEEVADFTPEVEMKDVTPRKAVFDTARLRTQFHNNVIKDYRAATSIGDLGAIHARHKPLIDKLAASEDDNDNVTYDSIRTAFEDVQETLRAKALNKAADDGDFNQEVTGEE